MGNSVLDRLVAAGEGMATVSLPRGRHRLHTMPTSAGYERQAGGIYEWDGLRRGQTPFTVLQVTLSGIGNLLYEGRRHRLTAGDTMLVIVPHRHRYWLEPGDSWEYFWISTMGREAITVYRDILSAAGPVMRLREDTVERLAACCLALRQSPADTPGRASALAYEAMMALYDEVLFRGSTGPGGNDPVSRATAHIRNNLADELGVPSLAEVAGLSRSGFTRLFIQREGVPPAEFVERERMIHAGRLLAQADARVKTVSLACGYRDPNYFAKVFRRVFGVSPTDFRTTGMYASQGRIRGD